MTKEIWHAVHMVGHYLALNFYGFIQHYRTYVTGPAKGDQVGTQNLTIFSNFVDS